VLYNPNNVQEGKKKDPEEEKEISKGKSGHDLFALHNVFFFCWKFDCRYVSNPAFE